MKLFKRSNYLFKISGSDGLDLLNRISTNDCLKVDDNNTISTILLDDKGKIVDILELFYSENQLYMLANFDQSTLAWIDRFVFTEDISFDKLDVTVFEELSIVREDSKNKILDASTDSIRFSNFQSRIFHIDFKMLAKENVTESQYNDFRVNHLLADFGSEITDKTIPLEIGFIDAISFHKGCYIGQEIIARLEAMHKVSKYFAKLVSDEAVDIDVNQALISESGNTVGRITSVASDKKSFLSIIHKSKIEKASQLFIEKNSNALYVDTVITNKTYQNI